MKKLLLLLLPLLLVSCSAQLPLPLVDTPIDQTAAAYIQDLQNQDTSALIEQYPYSSEMQKVANEQLFAAIFTDFEKYGAWQQTASPQEVDQEEFRTIIYPVEFEKGVLNISITFDTNNRIAGLHYAPGKADSVSETAGTQETEVTFGEEPYLISGSLALPSGEGPFPAVVLVQGSGPSDRNETVGANTPFLDIASFLADNGIATLRYDKRTYTYGAQINPETITPYEETIQDAVFAFDFLKTQQDIDASRIFILGHSLGGYLMPQIAEDTPDAAGYIMVAAPSSRLEDLMATQYDYIFHLDGTMSTEEQAQLAEIEKQRDAIRMLTPSSTLAAADLLGAGKDYWLYLKGYDPASEITKIKKPLLFLQGERDYQVPPIELDAYQSALEGRADAAFKTYPDLNHLLYAGQGTSGPEEYNTPGNVSDALLSDLAGWIQEQ